MGFAHKVRHGVGWRELGVGLASILMSVSSDARAQVTRTQPRQVQRKTTTVTATTPTTPTIPKQIVKLHSGPHSVQHPGTVHLVGFAVNTLGGRLEGLPIRFRWDTGGCNATTDATGRASCHTATAPRMRGVDVTFAGNERYVAAEEFARIWPNGGYADALVVPGGHKVALDEAVGRKDGSFYLRARVTHDGSAVKGQLVRFYAGGRSVGSARTNGEGFAHRLVPAANADLLRFYKDAINYRGTAEASLPSGTPALDFAEVRLNHRQSLCPSPPRPITSAPSFVTSVVQKCKMRTATARLGPRPQSRVRVHRAKPDGLTVLAAGSTTVSSEVPPRPSRNPGCDPNAKLGEVCKQKCIKVEYLALDGYTLSPAAQLAAVKPCQAGQHIQFTPRFDWLRTTQVMRMAWDQCADTAPAGSGASWSHDTALTVQLAVAPIYQYQDGYMSADGSQVFSATQSVVDRATNVPSTLLIECR